MYEILLRWLKGYLIIIISGKGRERFLDLCAKNDIELSDVICQAETVSFVVSHKNYKKLEGYRQKSGVDLRIKDKKGLPFFFYKYKKRKCFFIGLLLCLAIIYSFTLFIWDINISGESLYTEEEIREDIVDNYVKLGTLKSNIDCTKLEKELREKYDKIAWISCEIKGTQLNINFTETIDAEIVSSYDEPCNIVAVKDGIITDIITKSGTAIAKKGDEIKKGDILISGVVNIYNDYDELIETEYVPADGEIYAVVEREYNDVFSLEHIEKEYGGKEKKYFGIGVGELFFQFFKPKNKNDHTDIVSEEHKLKLIGDFYLPISINITCVRPYNLITKTYTEKEAEEKAYKRLSVYLDELRKKDVEILENNVTIDITGGELKAYGTIVTKELIGVPSDITIIEQGETQ